MLHHCPEPGVDSQIWHSRRWWRALCMPTLRVVLCADSIEVFLFNPGHWPGQRPRLLQHWLLPVNTALTASQANDDNEHSILSTGLQPAAAVWATLAQVLAQVFTQVPKRVHATLVISNRYARFLLAPWQATLRGASEWSAYHRHCLQQHFGEQAADWQLWAAPGQYGQAQLLCAVHGGLLAEASAQFAHAGICLSAVTPAWILSVNHTVQQMRRQKLPASGWVLCRESDGLTLGSVHQGAWVSVDYQPLSGSALGASTQAATQASPTPDNDMSASRWTDTLWQMLQRAQWTSPQLNDLPLWTQELAWSDSAQQAFPDLTVHSLRSGFYPGDRVQRSMQMRAA